MTGRRSRIYAEVRLFCFPHAGGGASAYHQWPDLLPKWIDVAPVQPPGREQRIAEPPIDDLTRLVEALADGLADQIESPYAFFGHSLGALVAFELARERIAQDLPGPIALFVSGARPPDVALTRSPLAHLDDDQLARTLRELGGVPAEVLDHDELWGLIRPTLRADLRCLEGYRYRPGITLTSPIVVFGGRTDPLVALETLSGWERHTTAASTIRTLPGGHFFISEQRQSVLDQIERTLRHVLA